MISVTQREQQPFVLKQQYLYSFILQMINNILINTQPILFLLVFFSVLALDMK